ncbi:hypothetical protein HDU97_001570 [Phlyctochytrium planicorne]|nr:hypothetical protein HDU97_001570 [Phlyctochytrium planicorne]
MEVEGTESTPLLSEGLETVTTPTSNQHVHFPLRAVNGNGTLRLAANGATSAQPGFLNRVYARVMRKLSVPEQAQNSGPSGVSRQEEDVEAARGAEGADSTAGHAGTSAAERVKGQCWCCWEDEETPENQRIRACLGCKDPDLQYIHQECIDRWVTALPQPRTPPPHIHRCTRCGDVYEVEMTPIPRYKVLLTDPFLRFAMFLMLGCIAILTVCCGALIVQHWGTGLNIIDLGPWFRIRMTTFAAFMLAFCHGINFATCMMVWEHCGGESQKHVVGIPDEDVRRFEELEATDGEGAGDVVRRERSLRILKDIEGALPPEGEEGEGGDQGADEAADDETRPLLGGPVGGSSSGRSSVRARYQPSTIGDDGDAEEEDSSSHRSAESQPRRGPLFPRARREINVEPRQYPQRGASINQIQTQAADENQPQPQPRADQRQQRGGLFSLWPGISSLSRRDIQTFSSPRSPPTNNSSNMPPLTDLVSSGSSSSPFVARGVPPPPPKVVVIAGTNASAESSFVSEISPSLVSWPVPPSGESSATSAYVSPLSDWDEEDGV